MGMRLQGFRGMLSFEPLPGVRLGRELAENVRFYGIGGVFHSDELPADGLTESEIERLRARLNCGPSDAFVILAGPEQSLGFAFGAMVERLKEAFRGIPSETRGPTPKGETRFSRPGPGAARMYPETDIPPIPIPKELVERLGRLGP